ncbi:D-alanyl-D-alanine carboxypeptidase family protein [Actinomadura keratinilytica]
MLFADTVLPKLPKDEEHLVTDEELAGVGAGSSLVGVKEDQTYTVHDLWLGVFLSSGNDAVHVLSAMNDGIDKTVADMNAHAEELQALDTHVVSPDGYDAKGQLSSAYDLTLIARSGMQKKDFREYCATVSAEFPGEKKKGKKREHFGIQNTNRLLTGAYGMERYEGIAGVKNGNTTNAGATFTGVAERDGRVLLVTVMNPDGKESNAVYQETARLFDWGFEAAEKAEPVGTLVPPVSAVPATGASGAPKDEGAAGGAPAPAAAARRRRPPPAARTGSARRWRWRAARWCCSAARCTWSTGAARCPGRGRAAGAAEEPGYRWKGSRRGVSPAGRARVAPPSGSVAPPVPSPSSASASRAPPSSSGVAVQAAQTRTSLAVKLIHRSRAMGTPKAPYMLLAATPLM